MHGASLACCRQRREGPRLVLMAAPACGRRRCREPFLPCASVTIMVQPDVSWMMGEHNAALRSRTCRRHACGQRPARSILRRCHRRIDASHLKNGRNNGGTLQSPERKRRPAISTPKQSRMTAGQLVVPIGNSSQELSPAPFPHRSGGARSGWTTRFFRAHNPAR